MEMNLVFALATDDGETLVERHFGDALKYQLYLYDEEKFRLIKTIENVVEEESDIKGGDPVKASNMKSMLISEQVTCIVGHQIGPNILRMKKKFVAIVSRSRNINEVLNKIGLDIGKVVELWESGENRDYLVIK